METAVVSQLIDQYGMDVMRFCRSLTRCACDAEDLYQQTFLKLLQLRVKVEREQNPRAFLFSIASGIWKNECRKWGRRTDIAPSSSLEELLEQPPQEPPDGGRPAAAGAGPDVPAGACAGGAAIGGKIPLAGHPDVPVWHGDRRDRPD